MLLLFFFLIFVNTNALLMLIYACFFRQLGISVCKPQKSQKIRIEKLDKRKKDPEYIEPSLVFVCDRENTTAHAYEKLGEISPYYQNDKLP